MINLIPNTQNSPHIIRVLHCPITVNFDMHRSIADILYGSAICDPIAFGGRHWPIHPFATAQSNCSPDSRFAGGSSILCL